MAGRHREFDRDLALDAAMLLFWRKGFAATSINDICAAIGITSPSLYAAFGAKENLYLEAIERYREIIGPPVWNRLLEGGSARDAVQGLLLAAAERMPKSRKTPGGCMAMQGAMGDELPPVIVNAVRKIRLNVLNALRGRFEHGVAQGELPPDTDIDGLSRHFLSTYQGMAMQALDGATTHDLRGLVERAMAAWPIPTN